MYLHILVDTPVCLAPSCLALWLLHFTIVFVKLEKKPNKTEQSPVFLSQSRLVGKKADYFSENLVRDQFILFSPTWSGFSLLPRGESKKNILAFVLGFLEREGISKK